MEAPRSFVPDGFEPPRGLVAAGFVLEPLGPQHNEADYVAWTSSIAHIRVTPGFVGRSWPQELSLAENFADLEMHARDFAARQGFAYIVLDPGDGDVMGCVYIYPPSDDADSSTNAGRHGTSVRSWVRADRAALDKPLWRAVSDWLEKAWPFERVAYATRS